MIILWFSGEVAWTTIGRVVDTEPGFIGRGWIRKKGAGATTEFFAAKKHIGKVRQIGSIKIVIHINFF